MERAQTDTERLLELSIAKLEALREQRTASHEVDRLQRAIDKIDEQARAIQEHPTTEVAA